MMQKTDRIQGGQEETKVPAIKVDKVTKVYKLFNRPMDRLKEALNPFHKEYHKDFFALDEISFDVEEGQFVGIIGTNGSGKSTILKIITGVLTPTTGTVTVNGRVSALLELGAGFNMEYTGIENVYMNGTMMGYSREEMDKKLPEILEFADIGDFVYQPVKSYSSGMFVRLAFALAINIDPEILIVDEALAVGDVFFQAKCYKKINEICQSGTTVILVTHDMSTVIKYCNKVVVLNRGKFVAEGEAGKMVDLYKKILAGQLDDEDEEKAQQKRLTYDGETWKSRMKLNDQTISYGDKKAEIVDVGIFDHNGDLTSLLLKNKTFLIKMKVLFHQRINAPIFAFTIKDNKGTEITGTNTLIEQKDVKEAEAGEIYTITFKQKMSLQGGEYLLSLGCTAFEGGEFVVHDRLYDIVNISVISNKNTVGLYDMNTEITVEKE